ESRSAGRRRVLCGRLLKNWRGSAGEEAGFEHLGPAVVGRLIWEAVAMGDDESERGGEAGVALEGPGLASFLADGAVEAFEEARGPEEARLPGVAPFAGPGQGIEIA